MTYALWAVAYENVQKTRQMTDKNSWKNSMEFEKKIEDNIKSAILCKFNLGLKIHKMAIFCVSN